MIAILGCTKCGADLPPGALFCAKCGKPVSVPGKKPRARDAGNVIGPELQQRPRKRLWRWVPLLLLGFMLVAVLWVAASDNPFAQGIQELVGWKHDETILNTPFSVSAHNFRYYKFSLPEGSVNVSIVGQFTASAEVDKKGTRNDRAAEKGKVNDKEAENGIEVYVLSEPSFAVWQNGYASTAVYESGRVSQGTVQADLPAGAGIYYLIFNNKFAPRTAKNVNANVLLRYKSWLPESLRRMRDRLSNWLGL